MSAPNETGTASIRCDDCFLLTAREAERKKVLVSEVLPVLCAEHLRRIQEHARQLDLDDNGGSGQS